MTSLADPVDYLNYYLFSILNFSRVIYFCKNLYTPRFQEVDDDV